MKKIKWPWPFKKKEAKLVPIDLSEFKEVLEPYFDAAVSIRASRDFLNDQYQKAHRAFWNKIEEVVGYDLPGSWTFSGENYAVKFNGDRDELPKPLPSQSPSYEEFWAQVQKTFYRG